MIRIDSWLKRDLLKKNRKYTLIIINIVNHHNFELTSKM